MRNPRIRFLTWAGRKGNKLFDIRRDDLSLIYAVTGRPRSYDDIAHLLETGRRLVDHVISLSPTAPLH